MFALHKQIYTPYQQCPNTPNKQVGYLWLHLDKNLARKEHLKNKSQHSNSLSDQRNYSGYGSKRSLESSCIKQSLYQFGLMASNFGAAQQKTTCQ